MEILKPDGTPMEKARCVAKDCKSEKLSSKTKVFCLPHELNVPKHLRVALVGEFQWLARKGLAIDQHTIALLNVAASREYAIRLTKDPAELAKWEAEKREIEVRERAQKAGLILGPPTASVEVREGEEFRPGQMVGIGSDGKAVNLTPKPTR